MFLPVIMLAPDKPLAFEEVRPGAGKLVVAGDVVTVHVVARNQQGKTIVDTSRRGMPLQFVIGPDTAGDWRGAVLGMKTGGIRRIKLTTMNAAGKKQGPMNDGLTVMVRLLKVEVAQ